MEQQALTYLLQQGPAVVVSIAVALAFGWATVKLFKECKEERETSAKAHAAELLQARQDFGAILDRHGAHLEALTDKVQENTHAVERLTDRIGARAA